MSLSATRPTLRPAQIAQLQPSVRDHEPRLALDGGPDGLDVHRRIIADAKEMLEPSGLLGLEIAFDQGTEAHAPFRSRRLSRKHPHHPRRRRPKPLRAGQPNEIKNRSPTAPYAESAREYAA